MEQDQDHEPVLRLATKREPGQVRIEVWDNGTGMNEETMEKMFNPFFTTKEAGQGTGLRLSLSFDIVRKHWGELTAESEEGRYTRMTVALPAGQEGIIQRATRSNTIGRAGGKLMTPGPSCTSVRPGRLPPCRAAWNGRTVGVPASGVNRQFVENLGRLIRRLADETPVPGSAGGATSRWSTALREPGTDHGRKESPKTSEEDEHGTHQRLHRHAGQEVGGTGNAKKIEELNRSIENKERTIENQDRTIENQDRTIEALRKKRAELRRIREVKARADAAWKGPSQNGRAAPYPPILPSNQRTPDNPRSAPKEESQAVRRTPGDSVSAGSSSS